MLELDEETRMEEEYEEMPPIQWGGERKKQEWGGMG